MNFINIELLMKIKDLTWENAALVQLGEILKINNCNQIKIKNIRINKCNIL